MKDFEDLEDELRSFRPMQLPAKRLREIGADRTPPAKPMLRRFWQPVMLGALAAASVALLLTLEVSRPAPAQPVVQPIAEKQPPAAKDIPPTTAAYMQAFAESPEKFEQLLSAHGGELLAEGID